MSAITVSGDLLHYEVLGRGRPVVLLHSWLGSWRYWIPTMQQLSVKYRIYALDLWGFGDSGRNKQFYHIEGQAQLLEQFLERMGITKAVFIGHGLGAAVLAHFATRPNCGQLVHRMMIISPPLFGSGFRSTTPTITPAPTPTVEQDKPTATTFTFTVSPSDDAPTVARLSDADRAALLKAATAKGLSEALPASDLQPSIAPAEAKSEAISEAKPDPTPEAPKPTTTQEVLASGANNPVANMVQRMKPPALLSRHVDNASPDFEKLRVEVEKADEEAMRVSSLSLSQYNPLQKLLKTPAPALAIFGNSDTFIQTPDESILETVANHEQIRLLVLQNIRHFPMLEDTARFMRLMKEFLEAPDIQQLEMKDEWKRRLR